ncbi:MAG: hypothetical protein WA324_12135 [Bryobacteraceae bacterium]
MKKFTIAIVALFAGKDIVASALISFEQALQAHHIALTRTAIIDALRNPDPEVRSLAASKLLVNDHALETIPLIEAALAIEDVPQAKINTAFALAQVGDELGLTTLQNTCTDSNVSTQLRLKSARYLLQIGREGCIGAAKEALRDDLAGHMNALSVASAFRNLSENDSQELARLVLEDLTSKEPVIRLRASHALGIWGRPSFIPDIRNALASETDGPTRAQMERDLALLSSKSGASQ